MVELLRTGFLGTVTYGFRRGDAWIEPTLRYTARDLMFADSSDDDPGRVRPGADVSGANFYSYLTYSPAWAFLMADEKETILGRLPFRRGFANEPSVNGYFSPDRVYSSGGRALDRASLRSY